MAGAGLEARRLVPATCVVCVWLWIGCVAVAQNVRREVHPALISLNSRPGRGPAQQSSSLPVRRGTPNSERASLQERTDVQRHHRGQWAPSRTLQSAPSPPDFSGSSPNELAWVDPTVLFMQANLNCTGNASTAPRGWQAAVDSSAANQPLPVVASLVCVAYGMNCSNTALVSVDLARLAANQLQLPTSLCGIIPLTRLVLSFNLVAPGVSIPSCIGALTNLRNLQMIGMKVVGSIPASLGNAKDLQILAAGTNRLIGSLPATLSSLSALQAFQLQYNRISGSLPAYLGAFTNLTFLSFYSNSLSGSIPSSLGNLVHLQYLALGYNSLSGPIPSSMGNLVNLVYMHLGYNNLSGTLPASLGSLQSLTEIVITFNTKLTGTFPASFNNLSTLAIVNIFGNGLSGVAPPCWASFPNLTLMNLGKRVQCPSGEGQPCCGGPPNFSNNFCQASTCISYCLSCDPGGNGSLSAGAIVGICFGASALLLALLAVFWWIRRRRARADKAWEKELKKTFRKYTWDEIVRATDNFSEERRLGKGGFGTVYWGEETGGEKIAVKRADRVEKGSMGRGKFEEEVLAVHQLSHRSLVRLLGYCSSDLERILVYEFMPNGTLAEHIIEGRKDPILSFEQRLDAALDVAEGLKYLHDFAGVPLVHRDIKPENILLTADLRAKIADFGLIRTLGQATGTHYTHIAGTTGYMDPEFLSVEKVSTKADLYSFGVVLLEMMTGRRAIIDTSELKRVLNDTFETRGGQGAPQQEQRGPPREEEDEIVHISAWAEPYVLREDIAEIADPHIASEASLPSMLSLMQLSLDCMHMPSVNRPAMSDVCVRLSEIRKEYFRAIGVPQPGSQRGTGEDEEDTPPPYSRTTTRSSQGGSNRSGESAKTGGFYEAWKLLSASVKGARAQQQREVGSNPASPRLVERGDANEGSLGGSNRSNRSGGFQETWRALASSWKGERVPAEREALEHQREGRGGPKEGPQIEEHVQREILPATPKAGAAEGDAARRSVFNEAWRALAPGGEGGGATEQPGDST